MPYNAFAAAEAWAWWRQSRVDGILRGSAAAGIRDSSDGRRRADPRCKPGDSSGRGVAAEFAGGGKSSLGIIGG